MLASLEADSGEKQQLARKLEDRAAVIGIVGMGYVGQPLALRYTQTSFRVIGFNIDQDRVDILNRDDTTISDISGATITAAIQRAMC